MTSWPNVKPNWDIDTSNILLESKLSKPTPPYEPLTLKEIIEKSKDFPVCFPTRTMCLEKLLISPGEEILKRNINSVYPIIHEYGLYLCALFLMHKRDEGTKMEKDFYSRISIKELIQRLIVKRAVSFVLKCDSFLLLDGTQGICQWEAIGTCAENPPLSLINYLSYDEMKLSALLSISSYSFFINNGNRENKGKIESERCGLESEGIVIGLVGPRFEKENNMEYQEIIVSKKQNTCLNGYGDNCPTTFAHKIFSQVYNEPSSTFNEAELSSDPKKYFKINDNVYFNNSAYAKRLALSFDVLLIEANHRAEECKKNAYIHVVGVGLGALIFSEHQYQLYVDTFLERVKVLGPTLTRITDIHFSHIPGTYEKDDSKEDVIVFDESPPRVVNIYFSSREPFTLLEKDTLLVVSYPSDSNALPGNEFWVGELTSSGNSAAAVSSQITEIHNPYINRLVSADYLKIATVQGKLISFTDYMKQTKCS